MSIRVRLPANMRALADDQPVIEQSGDTVGQVLNALVVQYPELKPRLLNSEGNLQSFVNVFIDDQSIRQLDDLRTPVHSGSEILILAALAGG